MGESMTKAILAVTMVLLTVSALPAAEPAFPELSKRVPFLMQRLYSTRWEVRYSLIGDLDAQDGETKAALEVLVRDTHPHVANQALVAYLNGYVQVDKSLFDARHYVPELFPAKDMPRHRQSRDLVDYCLGRIRIERKGTFDDPVLGVLDVRKLDDAEMGHPLTIVGLLGRPEDAAALRPFLKSGNDYVVLGAAKALLRLGDKAEAVEALSALTAKDPKEHLYYITEALLVLKEIGYPEYKATVLRVLSVVDSRDDIQLNWLDSFLMLAAEVDGDILRRKQPTAPPGPGGDR
jgi:hypothetical protein